MLSRWLSISGSPYKEESRLPEACERPIYNDTTGNLTTLWNETFRAHPPIKAILRRFPVSRLADAVKTAASSVCRGEPG